MKTRNRKLEIKNSKSKARNRKRKIENAKPKTRNRKLEIENSKSKTRNRKLEIEHSKSKARKLIFCLLGGVLAPKFHKYFIIFFKYFISNRTKECDMDTPCGAKCSAIHTAAHALYGFSFLTLVYRASHIIMVNRTLGPQLRVFRFCSNGSSFFKVTQLFHMLIFKFIFVEKLVKNI